MGVAFLGLITVWALIAGDTVEGADIRFLLPVPWVLAGIAGLVALITSDRRRHARRAPAGSSRHAEQRDRDYWSPCAPTLGTLTTVPALDRPDLLAPAGRRRAGRLAARGERRRGRDRPGRSPTPPR